MPLNVDVHKHITVSDESSGPVGAAPTHEDHHKRRRVIRAMIFLLIVGGVVSALIWLFFYRGWTSTDDAYVGGNIVVISSRQDGCVIAYYADNASYVEEGEALVQLDPTDYLTAFEQKMAALALAARDVRGLYEDVRQKMANVQLERTKMERALLDVTARSNLVGYEAIPQEDFMHSEADFKTAQASYEVAQHQLDYAESSLGSTRLDQHPKIINAKSDLITAYLQLQRCTIKAPTTGYVANRNVQVGQSVHAGTSMLEIIPLNHVWVDANFKETQLENIRIGQKVNLTTDVYGKDVVFHGVVGGIIPGTGSTFSLLPAQNATGNWIKIVQRVPVRIYLNPEELKKYPLVLGLTVTTSIRSTDTSGLRLADKPVKHQVQTAIYDVNLEPIEKIIEQIVKENLTIASATKK